MTNRAKCKVECCKNPSKSLGFCNMHYERNKRYGNPTAGRTPNGEQHKWLADHVGFSGEECLIWPYSKARGYGYCHIGGKYSSVSRYMCEARNGGPPTPDHEAAHLCGKGHIGCVNPNHLTWKTSAENKADQLAHGTRQRGEKRPNSKLTAPDVLRIRDLLRDGETLRAISRKFNVSTASIYGIKVRRMWGWLE